MRGRIRVLGSGFRMKESKQNPKPKAQNPA